MSYKYNLTGMLTEENYPSGRIMHHNYAPDGKLAAVSGRSAANKPAKSYAQNLVYNAVGAVTDMQLGNMRWEHTEFNSRLQPTKIALGTTIGDDDMLNLLYGYGTTANNGNLISQTIKVEDVGTTAGFEAVQTYSYDEMNRLKSATEMSTPNYGSQSQSWKQTYSFDRFGNRRFDTTSGATTTIPGTCSTAECNPTFNLANNRFAGSQGYAYDGAGNVTEDAAGKKFVYDGENKQKSFGTGGDDDNGGTYAYDGDGRRVKKMVAGETSIFIYDALGQMVAEYATTAPTSPQVNYLTGDTLGTPRLNTSANGAVIARHDYMPFGEDLELAGSRSTAIYYGADNVRQKFTSKERDAESAQDYFLARYYTVSHGRFSSPDPIAISFKRISNPQGWNLFIYAANNPLAYVDPTGMERVPLGIHSDQEIDRRQREIDQELADESTSNERRQELYTESLTLEIEREGNRVARDIIASLQSIGEGQGLQVSDFTSSTDVRSDFAGVPGTDLNRLATASMFVIVGYSSEIFINTQSKEYQGVVGNIAIPEDSYDGLAVSRQDMIKFMGTQAIHERSHRDPSPNNDKSLQLSEGRAYTEQLRVLQKFGPQAFGNPGFFYQTAGFVMNGSEEP